MPRPNKKGELNYPLSRKFIALWASEEGPNAIRQALKHWAECELAPDEALTLLYGGGSDTDLLADLEKAKQELATREQETRELIEFYETQLAEAREATTPTNEGVKAFLAGTWAYPQCRMVLLSVLFGLAMVLPALPFGRFLLAAACLWMFLLWCAALHGKDGYGPLLVKAITLAVGFAMAWDISHSDVTVALIFTGCTGLFMAIRLIENGMKLAGHNRWVRQIVELVL